MAHPFAHLTLDTLTREEVLKQFVEDLKAYAESTEISYSGENSVTVGSGMRLRISQSSGDENRFAFVGSFAVRTKGENGYVEIIVESSSVLADYISLPNLTPIFENWLRVAKMNKISAQEKYYLELERK